MKTIKRISIVILTLMIFILSSCMFFHGTEHEFGDEVVVTEPTCTEPGHGYRVCAKCNIKEEFEIPALGHEYTQYTVEKEAKCEETGLKKRTCTRCNHVDEEVIEALGHHFDDPVITLPAGCTTDGLMTGECTRCHQHAEEVIPALGHDFEGASWNIIIPGDCTHEGEREAICNRCHQNIKVNYGGSHNYVDSNITNSLGHTVIKSTCSGCNDYYYKDIEVDYTKLYGYKKLGTYPNGDKLQAMYKKIYDDLNSVFSQTKDYIDSDNEFSSDKIIASYKYSDYGLADNEATVVYATFINENYQFYFIHKTSRTVQYGTDKELILYIHPDFYLRSKREDYESRLEQELINLSNNLKQKTGKELNNITYEEKIKYIHDYLCKELTYENDTPEADWAHTIEGLLYKRRGVCETYAEAYQLFSLVFGIETICVSGTADGGTGVWGAHKWNYTKVNDKWYLMDVTWDDRPTIKYDYWLIGSVKASQDHAPTVTDRDNPSPNNTINFQIDLPELASSRYIPQSGLII